MHHDYLKRIKYKMKFIITLSLLILTSACANYKLEIQQGNLITQEDVSKLQKGMSKSEVQALLGTPLLKDNFNNNRWDYVFYQHRSKDKDEEKNLSLTFENDQLVNVSN